MLYIEISYDFKKSNEHEAQQLCNVNRPISISDFISY